MSLKAWGRLLSDSKASNMHFRYLSCIRLKWHCEKRQSNCTQCGFPLRRYCKQIFLIGSIKEAFEWILLRLDCFLNCNILLHHLFHPCDIEKIFFLSFVEEGAGLLPHAEETVWNPFIPVTHILRWTQWEVHRFWHLPAWWQFRVIVFTPCRQTHQIYLYVHCS